MDETPYYLEGGNVINVVFSVHVTNLKESSEFYHDSLMLDEVKPGVFKIPQTSCFIQLIEGVSEIKDTGITFITDSVFTFHRKLVDEGVEIIEKPMRNKSGNVEAAFADLDNNVFRVVELN